LRKETAKIPLEAAKATPTGKPPPAAPSGAPKKETSKIPLSAAKPTPGGQEAGSPEKPKTIRIKPVGETPTVRMTKPGAAAPAAPAAAPRPAPAAAAPSAESAKKQTSRIPLEKVLGPEEHKADKAEPPAAAPIRVKPPSEATTVKVGPRPAGPGGAGKDAGPEPSETSRLDVPEMKSEEGAPSTKRKTIRVKRAGAGAKVKVAPVARAAGAPQEREEEAAAVAAAREEPHWAFPVLTVFAILTAALLVYVFCAQAFGPNLSLTQYSWGGYDMDLPWAGKIPIMRNATADLPAPPPPAVRETEEDLEAEEAVQEAEDVVEEEEEIL
jgi:hypothetical protein